MPSDFLVDLIDHKERVAKYMRIAAMEFFRRENDMSTPYVDGLTEGSNLFDLVELVINTGTAIDYPSCHAQLVFVFLNTLGYFTTANAPAPWLGFAISDLFHRAAVHDNSKFSPEEFDLYDQTFPELQKYAYGTPEYKAAVKLLGPAWKHHCEVNDHHPEFHKNGIVDMHGNQSIEMCCDWIAASERSQKDIFEGLEINKTRFNIDDHLYPIIENTVIYLKEASH